MFQISNAFKCVALLVLISLLQACSPPDVFVQEQQFFDEEVKNNPSIDVRYFELQGVKLKYVIAGARNAPAVVYIHGTPGGWDNGARYLMDEKLGARSRVVSLDRPGWGGSQLPDDGVEASFFGQNRLLQPLFEQLDQDNNHHGIILVGHSLGASIAPYIAMQNPELISGLILLAGSLDPELGSPRWYNWAASMGVVSWFLGADMRRANDEIMQLHSQLTDMRNEWSHITMPVTVIQGMRDKLVSPDNANFAEQVLINADLKVIRIVGANHFIPWEQRELVTKEINLMLDKIDK
ncbi:MAG: alpha/beta hydrolase [Pseudomonadales bacterium]